jgi:hypothetical protein
MARSDRDVFNDHVAALTRQLGVQVDHVPDGERRRLQDDARQRRLNEHEAALTVAYGEVRELLHRDLEQARVLVDRLALVGRQWRVAGLVGAALLQSLEQRARVQLRDAES